MSVSGENRTHGWTAAAIGDPFSSAEPWRRLGRECGVPFSSWEWASTWWHHFGAGHEPVALEVRDQTGEVRGIAPLYLHSRRPARVLRFIGHFPADQLGLVCAPADLTAVADAVGDWLRAHGGWDLLLLERVPQGSSLAALPGSRRGAPEPSPEIELPASWDEYLASHSSNFRNQTRRFERKMVERHGLRFRLSDDPARVAEDLEALFTLHEARWAEHGGGAFTPELKRFHHDLAPLALEAGILRFWIAEVEERPAAAIYGFRGGGADWLYQSGRDPRWERLSLGFLMTVQTIRSAIEDGLDRYKFLTGDESYKSRFATGSQIIESVSVARGPRGHAALLAKRLRDSRR